MPINFLHAFIWHGSPMQEVKKSQITDYIAIDWDVRSKHTNKFIYKCMGDKQNCEDFNKEAANIDLIFSVVCLHWSTIFL